MAGYAQSMEWGDESRHGSEELRLNANENYEQIVVMKLGECLK